MNRRLLTTLIGLLAVVMVGAVAMFLATGEGRREAGGRDRAESRFPPRAIEAAGLDDAQTEELGWNPAGLAALADPVGQPLLTAALSRLSPAVLYYYVLLAAGLAGSCGLRRGRALALSGGLYAGVSALLIGLGALGKLGKLDELGGIDAIENPAPWVGHSKPLCSM